MSVFCYLVMENDHVSNSFKAWPLKTSLPRQDDWESVFSETNQRLPLVSLSKVKQMEIIQKPSGEFMTTPPELKVKVRGLQPKDCSADEIQPFEASLSIDTDTHSDRIKNWLFDMTPSGTRVIELLAKVVAQEQPQNSTNPSKVERQIRTSSSVLLPDSMKDVNISQFSANISQCGKEQLKLKSGCCECRLTCSSKAGSWP